MALFIDGVEHVTAAVAAEKLATTLPRILMLLKSQELKGVQIDGDWFVTSESLACAKAHGVDMKVAKGCASYCKSSGCGCK
ncbi:MAG: hypothetical protein FIA91_07715 [Geobacter sp.]|nr:hypothetical protein [Geobacter sp.]